MPRSRYSMKLLNPVLYTASLARLALQSWAGSLMAMLLSSSWGLDGAGSVLRRSAPRVYGPPRRVSILPRARPSLRERQDLGAQQGGLGIEALDLHAGGEHAAGE